MTKGKDVLVCGSSNVLCEVYNVIVTSYYFVFYDEWDVD
jgi:hypothetical protein